MADIAIGWRESVKAAAAEKWAAFKAKLTPRHIFAFFVTLAVTAGVACLFLAALGAIIFFFPLLAGAFKTR